MGPQPGRSPFGTAQVALVAVKSIPSRSIRASIGGLWVEAIGMAGASEAGGECGFAAEAARPGAAAGGARPHLGLESQQGRKQNSQNAQRLPLAGIAQGAGAGGENYGRGQRRLGPRGLGRLKIVRDFKLKQSHSPSRVKNFKKMYTGVTLTDIYRSPALAGEAPGGVRIASRTRRALALSCGKD